MSLIYHLTISIRHKDISNTVLENYEIKFECIIV